MKKLATQKLLSKKKLEVSQKLFAKKLSFNKLKRIEKATFRTLLVISFKIAIVYVFVVKLLSKRIISIANDSDARSLNKISRSLLITITIASKVSFHVSKAICEIY